MKKDIVVIGAGLAGILTCNELVKTCNVTLLECGDKDSISFPKIHFVRKQFAAVKTFCLGGGGTTNLWHNGLIPILVQDVVSDNFKEVLTEAAAYHDKAAANLFWLDNPYSAEYEQVRAEMNSMAERIGIFPDRLDCLLYPKKYSPLQAAPEVNGFYAVSDIAFRAVDKNITSVSYCAGGQKYAVNSDVIIIAAGTLGSPLLVEQVLATVNCTSSNVGRGLIDHPLGFIGKVKFKKTINREMRLLSLYDKGNYECRTALRIKSECGKYTGCAFFRPALTMQNNLSIYKYKSLLGASSGMDRIRSVFSLKLFHPDILAEIWSHLFGLDIPGRVYNILFLFEQKRGKSYVKYDGTGLDIDWSISDHELKIYKDMIAKLHDVLTGIAEEVNLKAGINEDWIWSAAHHSGTVSLGDGEEDLVDNNLRLKACDNVFVCDASIIQEHSYANTGLTIGALAMRLAERIASA